MSNIIERIKALNLPEGADVTLKYSDGTDVFVHNETEIETALENTDVVSSFSSLITTPGIKARDRWGQDMLDSLRDAGLLEDYDRGSFNFEEYVSETIQENFYDVDLIEYSTEKYDYKRGFCTLTASAVVTAGDLIDSNAIIDGWEASVKTENGILTLA